MNLTKTLLTIATVFMLNGCIVISATPQANVHIKKELTLDAQSLTALDVETGAGSLTIIGEAGLTEIIVKADIYTTSKDGEYYDLSLDNSGSTAYLVAKNKRHSDYWSVSSSNAHIDIEIIVPQHLLLEVDDGSGGILIKGINADVSVKDGSGELVVSEIKGNLTINDGSGRIEVTKVVGNVGIDDGSGEMNLTDITGHIEIEDGSGAISVNHVEGNIHLDDGSGDLTVSNTSGMVIIEDGSGDIDVNDIGGLKVVESGSGGLSIKNVKGEFEIDS